MKTHQGHSFNFQVLSALVYFIEEDMDFLALEGKNFEDSIFRRKNGLVTIGESKYIKSKPKWTADSLFFYKNNGPFIQLWNRDNDYKELVLFSYSSLSQEIEFFQGLAIPDDKLNTIIKKLRSIKNLKKRNELTLKRLRDFILKIRFMKENINSLEKRLQESLQIIGITTNQTRIRYFLGFINSDSYNSGDFLSKDRIIQMLRVRYLVDDFTNISYEILKENNLLTRIYYECLWNKQKEVYIESLINRYPYCIKEEIEEIIFILNTNQFLSIDGNFNLQSKPRPLIKYIKNNLEVRSKNSLKEPYPKMTTFDKQIFILIFESKWFRNLLKQNEGECYLKKFLDPNIMFLLANFLEIIFTIAWTFSLKQETRHLIPKIKDFNSNISFDEYAKFWLKNIVITEHLYSYINEDFESAKKYLGSKPRGNFLLDSIHINLEWLSIPQEFLNKMIFIERIQMTIKAAFGF